MGICSPRDTPKGLGRGIFLPRAPRGRQEPREKRAIAFFDGQNLFHAAKESFGYSYPSFDARGLARAICDRQGWRLAGIRFYTGMPDEEQSPDWHHFWCAKLGQMGRDGVTTFTRALRYRRQVVALPDGREASILVGQEKGIDVRLALDVVRLAHRREYDVALVFSQDQDLSEAADEIRAISSEQRRWIWVASAFPLSKSTRNRRGINGTQWLPIDRELYDACLDPRDYRRKRGP
jgi:uncharacterized LabA/DUF88 family protein